MQYLVPALEGAKQGAAAILARSPGRCWREISIFDIEFAGLTSFDIKFASLSKYNTGRANSFKTRDSDSFFYFTNFVNVFLSLGT